MSDQPNDGQSVNDDDVFFNDSRLFKLQTLFEFNTKKCTFCENGRKKIFAGVSEDSFFFYLMDADEKKISKEIPWDSKKFSIIDLCFDPSGTWLLVLSMTTLQIFPVLPLLQPDVKHDLKWPTDKITTVTLNPNHAKNPTAIVWWQTMDSQQIAIIGDKAGDLTFFSLENLEIIGKTCIVGGVHKLTIFVDDSLDNITLLITSNKNRQWKLTLEQRHCQYNWVLGKKEQRKSKETNRKLDGFIASIKELSSDKMSNLFQMKSHSVSDVPNKLSAPVSRYNPTPISLEHFQDANYSKCQEKEELNPSYSGINMSQWMLNPQSADGRHFISLFNSVHGTFTLQLDVEDHKPVFAYRLEGLPTDIQSVMWQQRIIYTFGYTVIQIHSSALASQQDSNIHTLIWEDDLDDGEHVVATWGVGNSSNFPQYTGKWTDTTDIDKLDLPRFGLDSCLVVTNKKTSLLTTRCDPCEWLVAQLVSGRRGVERTAAGLKVCLQPLLLAAADILLARNLISQALPLYKLAKVSPDEPLNRFAALGMYNEMLLSGFTPQSVSTGNICFISHVLATVVNNLNDSSLINFIQNNTYFSVPECLTLCADLGLWRAISTISFGKGMLWLSFQSLLYRFTSPCRGLWSALLRKHYAPFIVTEAAIPLLKYIEQYCETFDNLLLKELCIWMCPLQDCFHVIFNALATSQPNAHLSGMRRLIRTFFGVLSTLHSRIAPAMPQILLPKDIPVSETFSGMDNSFMTNNEASVLKSYPLNLSCGHSHWGVTHQGKACIKNAEGAVGFMNIDLEIMGKAISVSCGRHHTLLLTENGVYSLGDNNFGQLGIGSDVKYSLDTFLLVGTMGGNVCPEANSHKARFSWNNEQVTLISAGQYHSACVTDKGILYTWGWGVHGQLAHGSIFNQFIPKKVTTLKSEKIKSVGCGACHTAILTESGKVLLCGSGAFGQIGNSNRHKCNLPFEINLGQNVALLAVGYFHTLALTENNELWVWGSSPQSLRVGARGARRSKGAIKDVGDSQQAGDGVGTEQPPPSPPTTEESPHLYPTKVNTTDVKGKITKISAGWHHSCLMDQNGSLFVWGLNLDGQLGTGDQKEILIPTLVEPLVNTVQDHKSASPPKDIAISVPSARAPYHHMKGCNQYKAQPVVGGIDLKSQPSFQMCTGSLADVACGGDFTIFVNSQGKLYIAGNSYQQFQDTTIKGALRVVKMKNTKRILRLPNPRPPAQRTFRQFSLPNNFMEQSYTNSTKMLYSRPPNPISSLKDFRNPLWAHQILLYLHQFVDDDTPLIDIHLRAQLASLKKDYAEALNLQLNALLSINLEPNVNTFCKHSGVLLNQDNNAQNRKIAENVLLDNIKKLSRNLLDSDYKETESAVLDCLCDETSCLVDVDTHDINDERQVKNITHSAASIIKSILDTLPPSTSTWTDCVNQATMFWIDHELNMSELEDVFSQVVNNGHVIDMASAVFCTNDSIDYQKHLSPVFNLQLCDNILKYW